MNYLEAIADTDHASAAHATLYETITTEHEIN